MDTILKINISSFDFDSFIEKTIDTVYFIGYINAKNKDNYIESEWNGIELIDERNRLTMLTGRKIDDDYLDKVYKGELELYTAFAHYNYIYNKVRCINRKEYTPICYDKFKSDSNNRNISKENYLRYLEDNKDTVLDIDLCMDDELGYRIKFYDDEIEFSISTVYSGAFIFDEKDCSDSVVNLMKDFLIEFIK